jgi:hypothetical protein
MTPPPPKVTIDTGAPIRQELNVIKISLSSPGAGGSGQLGASTPTEDPRVLFDISVRGEAVASLEATADEVGLPLTLAQARESQRDESRFRLPSHILAAIDSVAPRDGWPLWLSFPRYCGYLPLLPWEPMLQDRLNVPMLRLSYSDVQPIRSTKALDVMSCFAFPSVENSNDPGPEQTVRYFLEGIPRYLASYTTFHLFASAALYPLLLDVRDRNPHLHIIVYDPEEARRYGAAENTPDLTSVSPEPLESPWLMWIRDTLGRTSIDLVHFVTHGHLGKEEGGLAPSHSPVVENEGSAVRWISARQICTFLDQIGAWSVAFSSPLGNSSISGLRMLQDQMARMRPGPVIFHDAARDPQRAAWDAAFKFAYAIEEAQVPVTDAISMCCHPAWALPGTEADIATQQLINDLTVGGRMPDLFHGRENTPSWLASGQRSLERSVSQLLETVSTPEQLKSSGVAEALRFTAKLLERHASKLADEAKKK